MKVLGLLIIPLLTACNEYILANPDEAIVIVGRTILGGASFSTSSTTSGHVVPVDACMRRAFEPAHFMRCAGPLPAP